MELKQIIENALMEMDVTPNLLGFGYIVEYVDIVANSSKMPSAISIYTEIADRHAGATWRNVERAIRHALSIAYTSENSDKWFQRQRKNASAIAVMTLIAMREVV